MAQSQTIDQALVVSEMLEALDETFAQVHGIYLDRGTSLFETLADITAEQASIPVGGRCATLAAQVAHITYYLDVNEHFMLSDVPIEIDWGALWRSVGAVTPAEWDTLRQQLRDTYQRVLNTIRTFEAWGEGDKFSGTLAIIVHTAYHLGEIRQALCVLRDA